MGLITEISWIKMLCPTTYIVCFDVGYESMEPSFVIYVILNIASLDISKISFYCTFILIETLLTQNIS